MERPYRVAAENKPSLGQVVAHEKSDEIKVIRELLELVDISWVLIPIDAIGCQKEIAAQIRQGRGDYVLAVERNQPKLHQQVEKAIDEALVMDAEDVDEHQTVKRGHGRRVTGIYANAATPESVDPDDPWRGFKAVGMAISERTDSQGRARIQTSYFILSRLVPVGQFADAVFGPWSLKNKLYWQLYDNAGLTTRATAPANRFHDLKAAGLFRAARASRISTQAADTSTRYRPSGITGKTSAADRRLSLKQWGEQ
ncbi:MAG: hypothetical protein NVSMB14_12020 [Isosphaeraceae bacterium]